MRSRRSPNDQEPTSEAGSTSSASSATTEGSTGSAMVADNQQLLDAMADLSANASSAGPALNPASDTPTLDLAGAQESARANPLVRQADPLARQSGKQSVESHGLQIEGDGVSPSSMDAAQRVVATLLGGSTDIQERLADADVRIEIVPANKLLTDMPSFSDLASERTRDGTRDWSQTRGIGGHHHDGEIVVGFPEENLVESPDRVDAYDEEHNISIHELAHAVHLHGLSDEQRDRIDALFSAQSGSGEGAGDFTDEYAESHVEEYFAQATQAFLGVSDYGELRHTASTGAAWLLANDPDMYAMLESIYGTPEEALARGEAIDVRKQSEGTAPDAAAPAAPAPAVS